VEEQNNICAYHNIDKSFWRMKKIQIFVFLLLLTVFSTARSVLKQFEGPEDSWGRDFQRSNEANEVFNINYKVQTNGSGKLLC